MLLWAAEHHGVQFQGITLLPHQHANVSLLIEQNDLQGRRQIHLQDYCDLQAGKRLHRIASNGMCEHCGMANFDGYFAQLRQVLQPGGLLINHSITTGSVHSNPLGPGLSEFIEAHILPGEELARA